MEENTTNIMVKALLGLKKLYKVLTIFFAATAAPFTVLQFISSFDSDEWLFCLLIYLAVCYIGLIVFCFVTSKLELVIYTNRIDGKYYLGKKFTLDIGEVQTIQHYGINGIKIVCKNGTVYKFAFIENRDDVCTAFESCGISINMDLTKDKNSVITSELDAKKQVLFKNISIVSASLSILSVLISWFYVFSDENYYFHTYTDYYYYYGYKIPYEDGYLTSIYEVWELPTTLIGVALFVLCIVFLVVCVIQSHNRVSISPVWFRGVNVFGKVKLIPIEQVEGVTTKTVNSSISINCTGKKYRYYGIKNNNLLCQTINNIKLDKKFESQCSNDSNETIDSSDSAQANDVNKSVEEIKQLKVLLDEGIISREEFDAKKKQILDL